MQIHQPGRSIDTSQGLYDQEIVHMSERQQRSIEEYDPRNGSPLPKFCSDGHLVEQ